MSLARCASLLLLGAWLFGCASQVQRPTTSQTIAEKPEEQQKKSAMPTFTYRPGG
jgi:hypothetical protein